MERAEWTGLLSSGLAAERAVALVIIITNDAFATPNTPVQPLFGDGTKM
jgi:hypothetical protein